MEARGKVGNRAKGEGQDGEKEENKGQRKYKFCFLADPPDVLNTLFVL